MAFKVLQNFGPFKAGDMVTGGDITGYRGESFDLAGTRVEHSDKGIISADRIDELCKRGILEGVGEDYRFIQKSDEVDVVANRINVLSEFDRPALAQMRFRNMQL